MPLLVVRPGLHSEDSTMVAPVCWTISGQQNWSGSEISISNEHSLNVTSHLLPCLTYLSTILSTYLYVLASFKAFSKIIKNWLLDHAPTDRSDSTILNQSILQDPWLKPELKGSGNLPGRSAARKLPMAWAEKSFSLTSMHAASATEVECQSKTKGTKAAGIYWIRPCKIMVYFIVTSNFGGGP